MSNIVIKVEDISKQYRLGTVSTGTLSHDLNRFWHKIRGKEDPYLQVGEANDRTQKGLSEYVWALKDINFEVEKGQVLGIIGRNGAGKSTLLKILSKVTTPTTGNIHLKGRIASLLEVGTGFHPELTGRENIFLNGAILGMTKTEIISKFDEIVDFSGIERYIDTPVKRYSSGMYVRLAFAVAAHLEPEILIVDEVLAVGDTEFQKKCLGKMKQVGEKEGRTVLFVSHNMSSIKTLCSKGLLLENGTTKFFGDIDEVIRLYYKKNEAADGMFIPDTLSGYDQVKIKQVVISNQHDVATETFKIGDDLKIELVIESPAEIKLPHLWISIKNFQGQFTAASSLVDGVRMDSFKKGINKVTCTFKKLPLLPQEYQIMMGMKTSDGKGFLIDTKQIGYFSIISKLKEIGITSEQAEDFAENYAINPIIPYEWDFGNNEKHLFNILNNVK